MRENDIAIIRNRSNAKETHHQIVAGFPGVGKSTASTMYPYKFIDMESSYYHWTFDENNNKVCNPNWPNNYVDAIIDMATNTFGIDSLRYIVAISTHKEVLDELTNRGICFDAVCPNSKDIYIQRYIDRGNNQAFVNLLQDKFKSFVQDVVNSNAGIVYFTDGYFANIFYDTPSYDSMTVLHNLNSKVVPSVYTDKIIVAVWPIGMASEIDIGQIIKPANQINVTFPSIIYHAKIETITETFVEPLTSEDKAYLSDCYYAYSKALANADTYPGIKFIAVDAYPDTLSKLDKEEMNYILLVPNSYEKYAQYCSDPVSVEEFKTARNELMSKCFHTIMSDKPVPLCFDSTSENISCHPFIESVETSNIEE